MSNTQRAAPPLWNRTLSRLVAAYPPARGQTRLRRATSPWLVGHLPCGAWARVSGVVDAEWHFLQGVGKEDVTAEYIKPLLRPGSVFVDVGANVGYFTLLASTLGARVLAYEPTPSVFTRLRENVDLNGFLQAQLVNAAVMDKPGTLSLISPETTPKPTASSATMASAFTSLLSRSTTTSPPAASSTSTCSRSTPKARSLLYSTAPLAFSARQILRRSSSKSTPSL